MTLTRTQKQQALQHILLTTLNLPTNSPVHRSFSYNAIRSPYDLFCLTDKDYEKLEYEDNNSNISVLERKYVELLKAFRFYFISKSSELPTISDSFWTYISIEDIINFYNNSTWINDFLSPRPPSFTPLDCPDSSSNVPESGIQLPTTYAKISTPKELILDPKTPVKHLSTQQLLPDEPIRRLVLRK